MTELECFATWGLDEVRRWATARGLSYGFERSVRLQAGRLETRRGLLSFAADDLRDQAEADVRHLCRAMMVPEHLLLSIAAFLPSAAFVHFGFECAGSLLIGKCYLELPPRVSGELTESGRLQFLGFKWSMNDRSVAVVTRYRSLPMDSWRQVEDLMTSNVTESLRPAMCGLVTVVQPPVNTVDSINSFTILEISEEGSSRRSYDLNVCDHGIRVAAIGDRLKLICALFDIACGDVDRWLQKYRDANVGHIAAGVGRNQQSFVTVYYGVEAIRPDVPRMLTLNKHGSPASGV